tara:strand:+ start:6487 stop:7089 length:603 start_codon:yes stop_codon:yes gene_type:complete
MTKLPFNIPQSLNSYVEKFDSDPESAISRLKTHLKKRGPDAVGHFLLAWFYHLTDENKLAIKEALKAKTFAPGSPLMQHLHYFLVHPELFSAAVPNQTYTSSKKLLQANRNSQILDLDALIAMLEAVESNRIRIPEDGEPFNDEDLGADADDVEDIVSETLAKIHVLQGNKKEAIKMYKQLTELNADKADYYTEEIAKLS